MADFRGYVTAAGQNFEALAKQMGYPVQIGTVEIGDGVLPDSESPIARTNLVNKLKSFPAILEVDPQNPGEFIVSCNIPADDAINGAGYFIREMGCRLIGQGAGVLYAYRRINSDFKPLHTEGEAKSFIYKLRFIPSNGELLAPVIDPSVVLASVQYCDNKVANELAKLDNKQSVRAATTGPIALSGAQTIDDVVLAVGNRVLVKDQADAKQNGIYLVAAQSWARTTDADTGAKLNAGARVYVEEGTVNGTKAWYLATAGAITIGVTLLQFKDEHPTASETVRGDTRMATQAQTDAGLVDDAAVSPKKLANHYRRGNAVGPVSKSAGVPTGAIIETGSNVNGRYIKYADGSMFCIVNHAGFGAITLNADAFKVLDIGGANTWPWPATFTSIEGVSIKMSSAYSYGLHVGVEVITNNLYGQLHMRNTYLTALTATPTVWLIAAGRWD